MLRSPLTALTQCAVFSCLPRFPHTHQKQRSAPTGYSPTHIAADSTGLWFAVSNSGAAPGGDYDEDVAGSVHLLNIFPLVAGGDLWNQEVTLDGVSDADDLRDEGVRLFGPNEDEPSLDLEPTASAFSSGSEVLFVLFGPNNAVGVIDLQVTSQVYSMGAVAGLGYSTLSMDASSKSDKVDITDRWPNSKGFKVKGIRSPLGITAFADDEGNHYFATANGGSWRDEGFSCAKKDKDVEGEKVKLKDIDFDEKDASKVQKESELGDLYVTACYPATVKGNKKSLKDQLYTVGTRGFSVFSFDAVEGTFSLAYDSDDDLAKLVKQKNGEYFNSPALKNRKKGASNDRGVKPSAIATGVVDGKRLLFVTLANQGGVAVFKMDSASADEWKAQDYLNKRNFCDEDLEDQIDDGKYTYPGPGDVGPYDVEFHADGQLAVANWYSGTTSVYSFKSADERDDDGSDCTEPQPRCADKSKSKCKDHSQCMYVYEECFNKPDCTTSKLSGSKSKCNNADGCRWKDDECEVDVFAVIGEPECGALAKDTCKDTAGCMWWTTECVKEPLCDRKDEESCKDNDFCEYKGKGECEVADRPVNCAELSQSKCKSNKECMRWLGETCVNKPECADKSKSSCKKNAYCKYNSDEDECEVKAKPAECEGLAKDDCKDEKGCVVWIDDVCTAQPECDTLDKKDCKDEELCEYLGGGKCRDKEKPPSCSGRDKDSCKDKSGCLYEPDTLTILPRNATCYVDPDCSSHDDKDDCEKEAPVCKFINKQCTLAPPVACEELSKGGCKKYSDVCSVYDGVCYDKPDCTGKSKKGNCDEDNFCRWAGGKCTVGPMCNILDKSDCKDEKYCEYKGDGKCRTDY